MAVVKQCILLAALLVASFQVIYGARFCHGSAEDYCFTITPENGYMKFQMNATASIGWVGLGIGDSMIGSYLVMAWPTSSGYVISQRKASGYSVPTDQGQQGQLTVNKTSSGIRNGRFIVEFQRPFEVEGSTISINTTNFLYAACNTRPTSEDSTTTALSKHRYKSAISLNLSTGDVSNLQDKHKKQFVAHGSLMFLGWAFTLPAAAAIARFGRKVLPNKRWFHLHWGIQLFLTTPLVIAGFVVGYYANQKQFDSTVGHELLGVIILAGLGVQIILGIIHHELFDPNRQYVPWWTKVHWWWGRLIFIAALVQIPLGLQQFHDKYGLKDGVVIVYYVYIGLLVGAFVFGVFLFKRSGERRSQKQQVPHNGVLPNNAMHDRSPQLNSGMNGVNEQLSHPGGTA